jgi:hypothetical protein
MNVRALTSADVPWMADVMAQRRAIYEKLSPVFWRPAANARDVHEPYLAACVASDQYVGLRTDDGFILGELQAAGSPPWWPDAQLGFVDDFAVEEHDAWNSDGRTLLLAAWSQLRDQGAESIRVVTARRDFEKVALLESVGLTHGESWWVRVNDEQAQRAPAFGPVADCGVEALVIPAPPVYDPGGPVLLVTSIDSADCVNKIPLVAAEHGAVLAILPCPPERGAAADGAGFVETARYYVGSLAV